MVVVSALPPYFEVPKLSDRRHFFLSKTFQILQNSNVIYKIFRFKMLLTVKYDGAPKHDKMCSKPHSQSMGP